MKPIIRNNDYYHHKDHQNTAYGCGVATLVAIWIGVFCLIFMALSSCTTTEPITPVCEGITVDHYAPQRIHLVIDRTEPEITLIWSTGYSITVAYPYYHDLRLVLCEGQTITINGECEVY